MFRIKICGITNVADAQAAVDAGADCLGLNFYSGSPRAIDLTTAAKICGTVAGRVLVAGVFVDDSAATILQTARRLHLDLIQLSGNEPPDLVEELARGESPRVMRSLRVGPEGLTPVMAYLDHCRQSQCLPELVLWDAYDPVQMGGTGRVANWALAAQCVANDGFPPLVLAGGLRADNVAEAIRAVRPRGVDTASGVEARPGKKDAQQMRLFVAAAKAAFDNPAGSD